MENLIKKAKDVFGTTDSCKYSTFILPEGKALDILKNVSPNIDYHPHDRAAEKIIGKSKTPTDEFIDLTGSIRYVPMRSSVNIQLGVKNPLTDKQLEFIERCTCFEKPTKHIVYDIVVDNKIVRASGTYDETDCFKRIDKLKKDCKKIRQKELQKQLNAYWEATAEERKRTHTGKLYDKYMKREKVIKHNKTE